MFILYREKITDVEVVYERLVFKCKERHFYLKIKGISNYYH